MRRSPAVETRALVGDTIASLRAALARDGEQYPALSPAASRALEGDLRRALGKVRGLLAGAPASHRQRAQERRASQWERATLVVLRHAREDHVIVERVMSRRVAAPQALTGFESGLGDPHDQGHTATRLRFGANDVYYKPRDATAEAAVFDLLHWIDAAMGHRPRPLPVLVPVGGHAWMSAARAVPVARNHAARAGRQAGEWLAFLDVLQAIDAHGENLLWCGDGIVPVDLETVLQPRVQWTFASAMDPEDPATVLRVGLLPGALALNVPGKKPVVHDSHGVGEWLIPHSAACRIGFARMYRVLARHAAMLMDSEPMRQLRSAPVRVVLRATRTYCALTRISWRDTSSSRSLTATSAKLLRALEAEPWPSAIRRSEAAAIARLDIPRFVATSGDRALRADDAPPITDAISEDGWTRACRRLACAGERDLDQRLAVIDATLQLAMLRRRMRRVSANGDTPRRARRR